MFVWQWWDAEVERRYALCRATRLHKACTTHAENPRSKVPTYLEGRVAARQALPVVEVVGHQAGASRREAGSGDGLEAAVERSRARVEEKRTRQERRDSEEENHAMLEFVLKDLHEDLVTELLEGIHPNY